MPKKPNVTAIKIGRYFSNAAVIPAPEIPPKINKGGSQHQLDAINAESSTPKLAYFSLRPGEASAPVFVGFSIAHGDGCDLGVQQSGAGATSGLVSLIWFYSCLEAFFVYFR